MLQVEHALNLEDLKVPVPKTINPEVFRQFKTDFIRSERQK